MCAIMARAQLAREGDGSEAQAQGTGGALSMEAVYQHTQGLGAASGRTVTDQLIKVNGFGTEGIGNSLLCENL